MTVPDVEAVVLGVGHEVNGVAVPHTRVVQSRAVVVDGHRAIGNLVHPVAVDIGDAQVMVALSGIARPLRGVGVEDPAVCQFSSVPVPGCQHTAGVVAAAEDRAWAFPVQVSYCRQETVGAVGAVVAPAADIAALRDVGLRVEGTACQSVEDGEVLWPHEDAAYGIAVIGEGIADHTTHTVACAVGGPADKLRPSVAVEVVDHELSVVGTGAYVTP